MNINRDEGDERDGKDLIPGSKFQKKPFLWPLGFRPWADVISFIPFIPVKLALTAFGVTGIAASHSAISPLLAMKAVLIPDDGSDLDAISEMP